MVIRMRHTRAHTGNRRSHHALKAKSNTIVNEVDNNGKETGLVHLRHRASLETGMYRGRQVIDITKKAGKKIAKAKKAA